MRRIPAVLLTLGILSGVLLLPWPGAAPTYTWPLLTHVVLGCAAAVVFAPWTLAHVRTVGARRGLAAATIVGAAILGLATIRGLSVDEGQSLVAGVLAAFSGRSAGGGGGLLGHGALLLLAAAAVGIVARALFAPVRDRAASRHSGLGTTLVLSWATATGLWMLGAPRDWVLSGAEMHAATGVLGAVAAAHHMALAVLARRRSVGAVHTWALGAVALIVVVGALGLSRAEHRAPRLDRGAVPDAVLWRAPGTAAERSDPHWPTVPASRLSAEGCGDSGCHEALTAEWQGSPHRHAATNALYRAAVLETASVRGVEGARFCARCHDPQRLAAGEVGERYLLGEDAGAARSEGVGCQVCHSLRATAEAGAAAHLSLAVAPPPPSRSLGRSALLLDPRAHDQAFGVDEAVRSNELCLSCHRLVLDEDFGVAHRHVLQDVSTQEQDSFCQRCHLPLADRAFDRYTHRMVGIHADQGAVLPASSGSIDVEAHSAAARTFAGLAEALPMDDPRWPAPVPLHPGPELLAAGGDRVLRLDARVERGGAQVPQIVVRTTNSKAGHRVPSGPFDLQQWWMEWRVLDAGGSVVAELASRPDGPCATLGPAPTSPRLGAIELGPDAQPLRRHRLFELSAVVDRRVIAPRAAVDDVLPVPLDGVRWPIEVRARWLFRRVNPDFSAFALDAPCAQLPTWEVGTVRRRLGQMDVVDATLRAQ